MTTEKFNTLNEGQSHTEAKKSTRRRGGRPTAKSTPIHIIPLGGLGEIGENMTVIECMNDMFVIDCGIGFPSEEMLGIDLVIPDTSWLEKNKEQIKGFVLTHGHEDHIGALPYVLKNINVPVYGTRLTLGLLEGKLKEHGLYGKVKLNVVKPGDTIELGCMSVEFIHVNHSIEDACALAIKTPAGLVVHSGDFKVDFTPIEGVEMIDLARFGVLGQQGVLALLMDSTNAERPGYTMSERKVGESFEDLFTKAEGSRIIVATFSSNINRVQQIINAAVSHGRHVAVTGRSMLNVSSIACQEELKLMLGLTKPKYFFPVHGEYKHLLNNVGLAKDMGINPQNITIPEIGKVFEVTTNGVKVVGTVPSGRILIDGLGVGDVGNIVLRDRKHLAEDGLIIVVATIDGENGALMSGPDIVSRGFVYVRDSEVLINETRSLATKVLEECAQNGITDWSTIKSRVKDAISKLLYEKTKRNPMILPVIMEV